MEQSGREYYLNSWKGIFRGLTGWSEEETMEWVSRTGYEGCLEDEDDAIFHSPPQYWTVKTLIPGDLWRSLTSDERRNLRREILELFEDERQGLLPATTDWSVYRPRLDALLERYGRRRAASDAVAAS